MKQTFPSPSNSNLVNQANSQINELDNRHISVSAKLNVVNILIFISGIFSIIGAYEIQLGGKMHELNYLHQKHITYLVKSVKGFELNTEAIENVEENIKLVRKPPEECVALVGPIESFMMEAIGTIDAVNLCKNDIIIANQILTQTKAFRMKKLDKHVLLPLLYRSIEDFEQNGVKFEPLVVKTVRVLFFIVITIVIGKAFVVPIIGIFLSRSVARDYQLLNKTKENLEKEKQRNSAIQLERISSLTTMVAGMAHEINTPVGASVTANSYAEELLESLSKTYKNGTLTESVFNKFITDMQSTNQIITGNLSRTATLVKSFKQVSVDQTLDELHTVNLHDYIEQVLISLTPITKKSGVSISINCNKELQACIYSGAFSQIITNLVTNAINHAFIDIEQPKLSITVTQPLSNELLLSFEDNGCGISESDQVHIFDPFFTTKRGSGGTGLGLHILHNLVVDKLKGRVICSNEIKSGTRFDIYFQKNQYIKNKT